MARLLYMAALLGLCWLGEGILNCADAQQPQADATIDHMPRNLLLILNQDQFSGKWQQFKGDLKETWGQFTDDDLYIEGRYDKYEGRLQVRGAASRTVRGPERRDQTLDG